MSDIPIPIYLFQYHITKFYFVAFSMYWGKAGFTKYTFINYFIPFIADITGCCFYFAFNFYIFVYVIFRPSTLNQNLMWLCITDFMEWEYVFCAHPTVTNLFFLRFYFLIFLLSQSSTFSVNPLFAIVTEKPFLPITNMLFTSKTCVVFTVWAYKILVSIVVIFILLFAYQCTT